MNKWRLPRKLKKKRKLLHLKWAVIYTEPMPLDKYLKEYPKTPDECFTWDIQKQKKMNLKRLKLAKECVGIINQLYDLAEVPTEKRQAINDKADKYLLDQVLRLCAVSQQRELLLAYHKYLDSLNDPTVYNASESMIDDYLANNCG